MLPSFEIELKEKAWSSSQEPGQYETHPVDFFGSIFGGAKLAEPLRRHERADTTEVTLLSYLGDLLLMFPKTIRWSPMRIPNPYDLEPIERASRDELQALQLKRIRWTLRHAYQNVPHYRDAFDAAGVHPNDLNDLTDIALFPFTVKDDFRKNYPFQMPSYTET